MNLARIPDQNNRDRMAEVILNSGAFQWDPGQLGSTHLVKH